jgi:peroxiredoxin
MIEVGDRLPDASVLLIGHDAHEEIQMSKRLQGKKAAIFAMPGAFSSTCAHAHMPNVIQHKDALFEKGVEEVIVLSVNDIFVSREWAKQSGAFDAGITIIADSSAAFSKAVKMTFDAPAIGLYNRSIRYALLAEDGAVTKFLLEESRSRIKTSGADNLLSQL